MKLSDHTNHIRQTVQSAVENRLGRLGIDINTVEVNLSAEQQKEKERLLEVFQSLKEETGTNEKAYEKLVDELTFTLFNRIAAIKVSEAHTLIPETITQRPENGNRSFAHSAYLEQYPEKRNEEQEGLVDFIQYEFQNLAENLPLYSLSHYYHLLPTAIELKAIIDAFNAVEADEKDIDPEIWKSDDVLGWLYESYNNYKKVAHKDSKAKTEYDKVSIQSQVYTPKWVVKFLVDNSLGKQYLEMYPHSDIKNKYAIANAPTERVRDIKPLHEIKLIDPAMGSGNFLLYAFDVFYDLYQDQIDNYGADYEERDIPKLILEHNLYGVDLDNRAAQIAQLGLYIKARRKKRGIKISHFNLVSSDFILPEYEQVKHIFNPNGELKTELENIVISLWDDLRQAHKFGALIRIEEIVESRLAALEKENAFNLFTAETMGSYLEFRQSFINDLYQAVSNYASTGAHNFMQVQATNAVTYLDVLTNKYDVAVANPPYTDSADFGPELKEFVEKHYKKPYKFHTNLYATFIKRCCELTTEDGKVAMIHPYTFMFIKKFEDVREYLLKNVHIDLLCDVGLDRVNLFDGGQASASAFYVFDKSNLSGKKSSSFIKLRDNFQEKDKKIKFFEVINCLLKEQNHKVLYSVDQSDFYKIKSSPFIYWISKSFLEKFKNKSIQEVGFKAVTGVQTGNNDFALRYFWEIYQNYGVKCQGVVNKWISYAKGGNYNKWNGNLQLVVNWEDNGNLLRNKFNFKSISDDLIFKEGITYSAIGGKISFRSLPKGILFDIGGSTIVLGQSNYYLFGFLNSKIAQYILDCLNPTVNTQSGDVNRLPYVYPGNTEKLYIEEKVRTILELKQILNSYRLTEINFKINPLNEISGKTINERLFKFINNQIFTQCQILVLEQLIDDKINEIFTLTNEDIKLLDLKSGVSITKYPLYKKAYEAIQVSNDISLESYLEKVEIVEYNMKQGSELQNSLIELYKSHYDLEDFCKYNQINPLNVWFLLNDSKIIPTYKSKEIVLEFVTDHIRTLLVQDDDGIIPLYQQALETRLLDRLVAHLHEQGFTAAQIAELDTFLGKPLEKYLEDNFFEDLANHLNLFTNFSKAPFIWHLSSGKYKAFEVYTSIYQWNRDSIFKLKSVYVAKRREQLQLRKSDLRDAESAAAQAEKELIANQLIELDAFEAKLDELIAENYNPVLDSGVAKNIAPLQKKGMIKAEILKPAQLTKYLNADW